MQRLLAFFLLSIAGLGYSQTPTGTKARRAPASSTAAKRKTAVSHTLVVTASSKSAGRSGTRGRVVSTQGRKAKAKPGPSYQLHPDPERYQQIQQALADRGYFKGQVNGEWGDDSVDALKRFQADQKLDTDGKINSLSLIGLGLGPRHDGTSGRDAPLPPPPAPSSESRIEDSRSAASPNTGGAQPQR